MQPAPIRRQWWAELRSPSLDAPVILVCVCVCAHYSQSLAYALYLFFTAYGHALTKKQEHLSVSPCPYATPLCPFIFNYNSLIELSPLFVPSFLDISISQINTCMGPECTAVLLRQQQSAFKNCLLVKCSTLLPLPADSVPSLCLLSGFLLWRCVNFIAPNQYFSFESERGEKNVAE